MKCSGPDGRVRMWRFSDVPGNNCVLIFRSCWWFGSTKTDDFSLGATKPSHPDAALCQRNFHWILSPWKLKTYTTYSVDKMLSIKPKDMSLALYGNVCEWLSPFTSHILLSAISMSVLRRKWDCISSGMSFLLTPGRWSYHSAFAWHARSPRRWSRRQQPLCTLVSPGSAATCRPRGSARVKACPWPEHSRSPCASFLLWRDPGEKIIYVSCVMRGVATLDFLFRTQCSRSEP